MPEVRTISIEDPTALAAVIRGIPTSNNARGSGLRVFVADYYDAISEARFNGASWAGISATLRSNGISIAAETLRKYWADCGEVFRGQDGPINGMRFRLLRREQLRQRRLAKRDVDGKQAQRSVPRVDRALLPATTAAPEEVDARSSLVDTGPPSSSELMIGAPLVRLDRRDDEATIGGVSAEPVRDPIPPMPPGYRYTHVKLFPDPQEGFPLGYVIGGSGRKYALDADGLPAIPRDMAPHLVKTARHLRAVMIAERKGEAPPDFQTAPEIMKVMAPVTGSSPRLVQVREKDALDEFFERSATGRLS